MINGISILIICRGRVTLLEELLKSIVIARSNFELPSEIIIVDNSEHEDALKIEALCKQYDALYYYDDSSVAIKRNVAASHAQYDILYFCDSDCIVTPNILNQHVNSYEIDNIGAVAGPVILQGEGNSFNEMLMDTAWCTAFSQPLNESYLEWGVTANFSIRQNVFKEICGFNEKFPNKPGGEDVDIGFRIRDKGYLIKSAPQAIVYHSNKTWLKIRDVSSRLFSYGKSNVLVVKEHGNRLIGDVNWIAVFCLCLLISIAPAVIFDWKIILMAPIFAVINFIMTCVSKAIRQKKNIFVVFKLELLSAIEKTGTIVGCFKYRTIKPLFRQVLYSQYQEHGTLPENQWTYLNILIAMSLSILYLFIIVLGVNI